MQGNLRWRERKSLYRRPDEQIKADRYAVHELHGDSLAKQFVETHHYSQSFPAARFRFALTDAAVSEVRSTEDVLGVAVFSHPANNKVLTGLFGGPPTASVELGRLVLLDEVPGNAESWFVARCLRALRARGLRGVVSFSDPLPRATSDGRLVTPGHVGTVYQALNARYLCRSTPRRLRLLPDATVFSDRAIQKVRGREQGWAYSAERLVRFGADPLRDGEAGSEWLARWLPRLTRTVRHPGNHRYAWALDGRRLESLGDYPRVG